MITYESLISTVDFILKILGILTIIYGVILAIRKFINRPFIDVVDVNIRKVYVPSSTEREAGRYVSLNLEVNETRITWNVHNHKKLKLFGKDVVDVVTKLSVINQKNGREFYGTETGSYSLLAIGQKKPNLSRVNDLISDGDYRLTFVIESKGKTIATIKKSATIKGDEATIK